MVWGLRMACQTVCRLVIFKEGKLELGMPVVDRLVKGGTMTNKTYKFVTILMVMLLVLGLALVACKAPAETVTPPAATVTPPAAPPPAPPQHLRRRHRLHAQQLTYKAKTYTNSDVWLLNSISKGLGRAPRDRERDLSLPAFGVPGFVPGVSA